MPLVRLEETMTDINPALEENPEETPQVTNLETSGVEVIKAELVRMHQSAAQEVTADEVELHQSAAGVVKTGSLSAYEAAMGAVEAGEVQMTNSGVGALQAENVNLTGYAGAVMAGTANLGNTYAGMVAGREVRGERIETLLLLGQHVEGEIQTVVDTRSAVLMGMVGGLFAGTILLLGRLVFGRR